MQINFTGSIDKNKSINVQKSTIERNRIFDSVYDISDQQELKNELRKLYTYCETPAVKPLRGQFLTPEGKIFNRHTTEMFRYDCDWATFGKYLKERFKDCPKVNTVIYACSDGSEPYTMSILFDIIFKEDACRFLPIVAKDISKELIERTIRKQSEDQYLIGPVYDRALLIFRNADDIEVDWNKYFKFSNFGAFLKSEYKKPVQFSCANILEDIESIDSTNPTIFMARNMWPYIKSEEYGQYAQNLYQKLAKGSIVVIGSYDYTSIIEGKGKDIESVLKETGFQCESTSKKNKSRDNLVFEKN